MVFLFNYLKYRKVFNVFYDKKHIAKFKSSARAVSLLAHHHTNHFVCLYTLWTANGVFSTLVTVSDRKGNFEEQVILVVQMTFLIRNIFYAGYTEEHQTKACHTYLFLNFFFKLIAFR